MGLDMYLNKKPKNIKQIVVDLLNAYVESNESYKERKAELEEELGDKIPVRTYEFIDIDSFRERYKSLKGEIAAESDEDKLKELEDKLEDLINWAPMSFNEEVGYWRKFNALHNWFVENVQDGVDECQSELVTRESFERLQITLEKVLEQEGNPDEDLLDELMPTTSGFFFGSTEYNTYYFEEVRRTKTMVDNILSEWDDDSPFEYYYQSSW